jgi:general stress protein CsbA
MNLTIGVTGHRDLISAEKLALREQVRGFFHGLRRDFPELQLELLTALAEGADCLVTEVAREVGIPFIAVLPMAQEIYENDFEDRDSLARFREQLGAAERVITLPPSEGIDIACLESPGPKRDQQYVQAGIFVSNHCQVLLALWDGRESGLVGGTADVLNYHLTGLMAGPASSDESPNLLADNENDLAYHIVCSRDRPDGAPDHGLKPGNAHWVTAHFGRAPDDCMPAAYHNMFERLVQFDQDGARFNKAIEQHSRSLLRGNAGLEMPPAVEYMDQKFVEADWLAVRYAKLVSAGLFATHVIAVLMGLSFILYSEYVEMDWLLLVYLMLFTGGVALYLWGERQQWHRKYLDFRALAEGLRVQLYWLLAGVVDSSSVVFAYDNFLQKQDVDLGWIRHVMRSASLRKDRDHRPDPAWVDWVIEQWVGQPDDSSGQVAYYARKAAQKEIAFRRTEWLGAVSLWVGISLSVVLLVASGRLEESQQQFLLILMGVLPLIAAVRSAYSHKKADKELIKQYLFMGRVFGNAHRLLQKTDIPERKKQILRALGNAALEEHAEWILMHRERPLEHGRL